ncbi:MAG: hypothetical protein IPL61_13330 [Myxococcales bacterium]|nr:hypothetical protein [Myxococcales bacterium]
MKDSYGALLGLAVGDALGATARHPEAVTPADHAAARSQDDGCCQRARAEIGSGTCGTGEEVLVWCLHPGHRGRGHQPRPTADVVIAAAEAMTATARRCRFASIMQALAIQQTFAASALTAR